MIKIGRGTIYVPIGIEFLTTNVWLVQDIFFARFPSFE